ncbi:nuclear GTPase SLIP-GC [Sorex araneus]|uniref:nuclear GTPase SLIP-GC n=1 Tax=Sorex araneus TaxID=42254 RepID=UPI00243338B9|nr:nuclear GTPase SLIP-GC [Sorex araneus]
MKKKRCRRAGEQQARPCPRVEQSVLKEYERLESRTRAVLSKAYQKLLQSVCLGEAVPPGAAHLLNRLLTLIEKPSLDPVYIGVLGGAGAGKSSLINALLQQETLLPVSGPGARPSCILQTSCHHSQHWEARVHLLSAQEWREELRHLSRVLQGAGRAPPGPEDEDAAEALWKLQLVYGPGAERRSYEELLRQTPGNVPASRIITLRAEEATELSRELEPYIRTWGQDGQGGEAETRLWPLVQHVEVALPRSHLLPAGAVLLDIPDAGDLSGKREETWRKTIDKCSVIWVLSDVERVLRGRAPTALLDESVRACQRGLCRHVALVVTKTDKLHLAEHLREREAGSRSTQSQREAVLQRNETIKRQWSRVLREKFQRRLPANSQILEAPDLVYTVSARQYWQQTLLAEAETEVPALRQHIWTRLLDRTRRRVDRLVADALGLLQLMDTFSSPEILLLEPWPLSELRRCAEEEVRQLDGAVGQCFALLEEPLAAGVRAARASYPRTLGACLTRRQGNRGLYQTLRAACLQGGAYASRHLPRTDLNQALAQPMYDQVDPVFGRLFGAGQAEGSALSRCLEAFKCSLQEKTRQVGAKSGRRGGSGQHRLLMQEVSAILGALEDHILHGKRRVYEALHASVQQDLKASYQEAAQITGQRACERLKDTVWRGVERQVAGGMFERARDRLRLQCVQLQEEISEKVKGSVGAMLTLAAAQGSGHCMELPDIKSEYKEMERLRRGLREVAEDATLRRGMRDFLLRGPPPSRAPGDLSFPPGAESKPE